MGRLDAVHALDAALGLDAVEDDVGADVEVVLGSSLVINALRMSEHIHDQCMAACSSMRIHTAQCSKCISAAACMCVHIYSAACLVADARLTQALIVRIF